jgi:excinuclease ABC subunit C
VPGVGPSRRKALLNAFGGDIDAVRRASVEQLMAVPGVTRKLAETIKEHL